MGFGTNLHCGEGDTVCIGQARTGTGDVTD